MLAKVKICDGFIYVNPDQVFVIGKWDDGNTIIRASAIEGDYIIAAEPIDRVAMLLNDAMRR